MSFIEGKRSLVYLFGMIIVTLIFIREYIKYYINGKVWQQTVTDNNSFHNRVQ